MKYQGSVECYKELTSTKIKNYGGYLKALLLYESNFWLNINYVKNYGLCHIKLCIRGCFSRNLTFRILAVFKTYK